MKIRVLDEKEETKPAFIEVELTESCRDFRLSEQAKKTATQAVELVYLLSDWTFTSWSFWGTADESDLFALDGLLNSEGCIKNLSDLDGDQIRLLLGVLTLAGFTGIKKLEIGDCVSAYNEVMKFVGLISDSYSQKKSDLHLSNYFITPLYPDFLWANLMFFRIPYIRGKSFEEVVDCMNQDLKNEEEKYRKGNQIQIKED